MVGAIRSGGRPVPLPETIPVKLSSEEAGAIAITPVVVEEMAAAELVEVLLGVAGKDVERIRGLLARGSIVSGATRFRWAPLEITAEDLEAVFRRFPDPEPARAFDAAGCTRVLLRGPSKTVYVARETAARRGLLRRRTMWDALMSIAGRCEPEYVDYSYRERADRYRVKLPADAAAELRAYGFLAEVAEYLVGRQRPLL
jgi:hypothetical protein